MQPFRQGRSTELYDDRAAQECVPLLKIARRRSLINGLASIGLEEGLEIVARMISGLINGLDKRDG
jgi:hypothetical protein